MATQQIEFEAPSGLTLTAKLFTEGSDTVAYTASAVSEETNRKGIYAATFSSVASGYYQLIAFDGTEPVAIWWSKLANLEQTYTAGQLTDAVASDDIATIISLLTSGNVHRQVMVATDDSIVLYNGRTYGGSSHAAITFTVSKDYQSATSLELVLWNLGEPSDELQRLSATAASETSITVSGLINVSGEFTGEVAVLTAFYTLQANWSGAKETIATGRAYIYEQPS